MTDHRCQVKPIHQCRSIDEPAPNFVCSRESERDFAALRCARDATAQRPECDAMRCGYPIGPGRSAPCLLADLVEHFVGDGVQSVVSVKHESELVIWVVGDAVDLAAVDLPVLADADRDHLDPSPACIFGCIDRSAAVDVRVSVSDDDGVVLIPGAVSLVRREHVVVGLVDAASRVRTAVLERVRDGVEHARFVRVRVQVEARLGGVAVRDDAHARTSSVEVEAVNDASGHVLRQSEARLDGTGSVQHEDDVTAR